MNREDIKQTMLLAMSEHHSGNAAEAQRIVDAILAAIKAAGVRLEPFDDTDNPNGQRSNMMLLTDHGTGCQYLRVIGGAITPRLSPDGTQLCTRKDESYE